METPGAVLRRAREEKGMSLRELSAITRISPRLLTALEGDEYDDFPAEVFVRGFLRNCARELEVDPDEVVGLYDRQHGRQPAAIATEPLRESDGDDVGPLFPAHRLPRASYLIAIVAVLFGLALSILIFGSSEPEQLSDHQPDVPTQSSD